MTVILWEIKKDVKVKVCLYRWKDLVKRESEGFREIEERSGPPTLE